MGPHSLKRVDGVATPPPDLGALLQRVREGRLLPHLLALRLGGLGLLYYLFINVKMVHRGDNLQTVSPLKQARLREAVLTPGSANLIGKPHVGDEINSLFDVFLLARLIVAGRRSGPLAARRRVLGSKDLTRVIAKFLARKIRTPPVRH